jgi:hypothetical protein
LPAFLDKSSSREPETVCRHPGLMEGSVATSNGGGAFQFVLAGGAAKVRGSSKSSATFLDKTTSLEPAALVHLPQQILRDAWFMGGSAPSPGAELTISQDRASIAQTDRRKACRAAMPYRPLFLLLRNHSCVAGLSMQRPR